MEVIKSAIKTGKWREGGGSNEERRKEEEREEGNIKGVERRRNQEE